MALRKRSVRAAWYAAFAAAALLAGPVHAGGPLSSGEVVVVLEDALAQNYKGGQARGHPFNVHFTLADGKWTDVWGEAFSFNVMLHHVEVVAGEVTDDRIRMKIRVWLKDDFWIRGGTASYEFEVRRAACDPVVKSAHAVLTTTAAREELDGTFKGAYQSPWATYEVEARAVGIIWPPRVPPKGFAEIQPGDRPRLLFRKGDVEGIRKKAKLPLGKVIVEKLAASGHTAGMGTMYHVTGDGSWAGRTYERAHDIMTTGGGVFVHETHQSTFWADRVRRVAYAYDLCSDAWDEKQRKKAEAYLNDVGFSCLHVPWGFGSKPICHPGHWKADKVYGGGGLMALALWGEKAPPPPEPTMGALEARFGSVDGRTPEELRAKWEADYACWKAHGGANLVYLRDTLHARHLLYMSTMKAIGEGGYGGHPHIHDFSVAFKNCFGRSVTGRPDINHAAAAPILSTVWHEQRGTDGGVAYRPYSLGGGGVLSGDEIARCLALCPEAWRGALMWYWLKLAGVTPEEAATESGARKLIEKSSFGDPVSLVYVLTSMPTDARPADPGKVFPRAWEVKTTGSYFFRNGWVGRDSILAELKAKDSWAHGGADAGTFKLYGLEQEWVMPGPPGPFKSGCGREQYSTVLLPGEWTNAWGRGKVVHFAGDGKTGSGVVSLDMSDVYRGREQVKVTRTVTRRDHVLIIQRPVTEIRTVYPDIGVKAIRSFAVDYGGASGAPGLIAMVDRLTGEHPKEWVLVVPGLRTVDGIGRKGPPTATVAIEGNSFTVTKGDATLKATFISPKDAKIQVALKKFMKTWQTGTKWTGWGPYYRDAIEVTSADGKSGEFFVVMTLQRGKAPEVKVTGSGLKARAAVGNQTVRFDGGKIVFGS